MPKKKNSFFLENKIIFFNPTPPNPPRDISLKRRQVANKHAGNKEHQGNAVSSSGRLSLSKVADRLAFRPPETQKKQSPQKRTQNYLSQTKTLKPQKKGPKKTNCCFPHFPTLCTSKSRRLRRAMGPPAGRCANFCGEVDDRTSSERDPKRADDGFFLQLIVFSWISLCEKGWEESYLVSLVKKVI